MLNIHPDYQFTNADYEKAVDLDWLEFAETPRELLPAEAEYVFTLKIASDIRKTLGYWPNYAAVLDFIEKSKEKEQADWNKTHAAKEAEWNAQHEKDKRERAKQK